MTASRPVAVFLIASIAISLTTVGLSGWLAVFPLRLARQTWRWGHYGLAAIMVLVLTLTFMWGFAWLASP